MSAATTSLGARIETWRECDISDLCGLQRGFDLTELTRTPGDVPVYSSSGFAYFHNEAKLQPPSVITGRKGQLGKVFLVNEPCWPHDTTLWVKDFKGNDPEFVYWFLTAFKLERFDAATSVPTLNRNNLVGIPIKLPGVPEQRAIAAALSDVDALIGALDNLIAKKHAIKLATMQRLLTGETRVAGFKKTWEIRSLRELVRFIPTANNARKDLGSGWQVLYIHYGDVHGHDRPVMDCAVEELPTIDPEKVSGIEQLRSSDLVIADASEDYAGIGKSVELEVGPGQEVVGGLHTIVCRGYEGHWAPGFKAYLQFIPAFKKALVRAATGISVYGISKKHVGEVNLALPDSDEQEAIVSVLSDMDAEIAALEHRRDKTRAVKQGMMQQLLTGRTRIA